jgi:small subunit ribosomal protein MRP21
MEVRKATDTLLRCQSSPLAGLLVPTFTLRWHASRQLASRGSLPFSRRRTFITTAHKHAIRPIATTAPIPSPSEHQKESVKETMPSINIERAAHELGWLQGGSSRYGVFPQAQGQTRVPPERELTMNHGNSAEDILKTVNSTFSSSGNRPMSGIDLSRMQTPPSQNRPESAVDMMSAITTMLPKPEKIPIRLSPTTGRTVTIHGHIDVAKAFKLMERTCVQNAVKRDSNNQRYHERRGQMKKRMRGVRWRVKFMNGFRATVLRVKQLRKQGW